MNCAICKKLMIEIPAGQTLDTFKPENPGDLNCGGDCAQCMADAGDPDCQKLLGTYHEEQP